MLEGYSILAFIYILSLTHTVRHVEYKDWCKDVEILDFLTLN